jgi:hypothetical protein
MSDGVDILIESVHNPHNLLGPNNVRPFSDSNKPRLAEFSAKSSSVWRIRQFCPSKLPFERY